VVLTPRRRRGVEFLDDPSTDPATRERSLADVRVSNALLGGSRAVLKELEYILPSLAGHATLLDVGTGLADIPCKARDRASSRGVRLTTYGIDEAESLARANTVRLDGSFCADARHLPFPAKSFDIVTCSQMLHHFEEHELGVILGELNRVARHAVIVSDLRRSWFAAGGFWLVSTVLRFHPVTRHDGVVSVLRGFTKRELLDATRAATQHVPVVRQHLGYRLTATWTPAP
jgi:ubiquinone/menaquinone biosynthesis C-methylase UbiE